MEIATTLYRSCAPPPTTWPAGDSCCSGGIPATGVLVETLLDRAAHGDVVEATDIAKLLGVSRATVFRYLAEDGAA